MRKRLKGVFMAESRLFATPLSLLMYFAAILVFVLVTIFFVANYSNRREDPTVNEEIYRSRLEEIDKELAALEDPSLSDTPIIWYEGREEALIAEKKILLHYLESGKTELDYIEVANGGSCIEDLLVASSSRRYSAATAAVNMYAGFALCFALICLLKGIFRVRSAYDGEGNKTKLVCDCTRKELLTGGMALDGCVLGVLALFFLVVRSILAFSGTASGFYIISGADVVFGNLNELFFAQALAVFALGGFCYFLGGLAAALSDRFRLVTALTVCTSAAGICVLIGAIAQYCTHDGILRWIAMPFFGIAFCFSGFRYYVYFIHLALCIAGLVVCCLCTVKKYCKRY